MGLAEVVCSQSLTSLQQLLGGLGDGFEGRGHVFDELLVLAAGQSVLANLERGAEKRKKIYRAESLGAMNQQPHSYTYIYIYYIGT